MTPLLTDGTISLRAPEPTDLDALYRWENDSSQWDTGSAAAPYSRKLLADYIDSYNPDIFVSRQLRFVIELTASGEAVGTVDLFDFDPHNKRAAVGIIIDPASRRRGLGRRALTLLTAYGRSHLDMHQLWAVVAIDNQASISLFRECGFKVCGRLHSWLRRGTSYIDAYMMQHVHQHLFK